MKSYQLGISCIILIIAFSLNATSGIVTNTFQMNNSIDLTPSMLGISSGESTIPIFTLKPGDIAFKHPDAFTLPIIIDHCLLCVDYTPTNDTYTFIEAHFHHGVQYRYEKSENLTKLEWGPFARVITANETQKQNAISFAKQQIGKEFQIQWINKNYNPTDIERDPLANEWYCSELIWAAYYNCNKAFIDGINETQYSYGYGIDIDFNEWNPIFNRIVVAPRDLIFDKEVIRLPIKLP